MALSLIPAACRATCPGHYFEARGKNNSTFATQLLANAAVAMGMSPQLPLVSDALKALLFAREWPDCAYGAVPTGDLLDYREIPKTATIFGSTLRRRGHPRGCSQQAELLPEPCQAAYSGPMAPAQQVLHFYQHLARATSIYVEQMPKAKILPTVCHIIHLVTTAAVCEIPLRLQPPPKATIRPLEKN